MDKVTPTTDNPRLIGPAFALKQASLDSAHDLTERQREIQQVLAHRGSLTFAVVREHLANPPSDRTIRNDLMHLRQLGLARLDGRGRGRRKAGVNMPDLPAAPAAAAQAGEALETSREATQTAAAILRMREDYRARITERMGRAAANGQRVMDRLFDHPIVTVATVREWLGLTPAGANRIVARLAGIGLLREITGYARNRRFRFEPYLRLFEEPWEVQG